MFQWQTSKRTYIDLIFYATENDGKNNDSNVFEAFVRPAEDC